MHYIEIQFWKADLQAICETTRQAMEHQLSDDERKRAHRFVRKQHGDQFTVHHAATRILLAKRLKCSPQELEFLTQANGKPELAAPHSDLQFSLSHTGHVGVLATCLGAPVGIDIEQVRAIRENLAERFFAKQEVDALAECTGSEQLEAFFRCWTRKEAFVKATGEGLSRGLDSFVVSVENRPGANTLRHIDGTQVDVDTPWCVQGLSLLEGYASAIAANTRHDQLEIEVHPEVIVQRLLDA